MLLLPARLTFAEANDTLRMLQQGLKNEPGDRLVVDAAGLQHFDSSALAVLLECERLAVAGGKGFEVRQMPTKLRELAGLYGIEELMPVAA